MQIIETTATEISRDTSPAMLGSSLQVQRNQRADWAKGLNLDFDQATSAVLQARENDGRRVDVPGVTLDQCTIDECPETGAVSLQRGKVHLALRETAFRQLCSRIGAPAPYLLNDLPKGLAVDCLRESLKRRGNVVTTVRAVDTGTALEARAFVGPRYANMDDDRSLPILRSVLASQGTLDSVRVRALAVGSITVLRCSIESIEGPDGRSVEIGGDFRNGELGDASLAWCSSLYREWCTNGCRSWTPGQKTRWRHVGEVSALEGKFRDALPQAFEHARKVGELCAENAGTRVLSQDEISAEFAKLDLTKAQQAEALKEARLNADKLPEDEDSRLTLWDAINGVTASARGLVHESRLKVEEEAGRLIARNLAA